MVIDDAAVVSPGHSWVQDGMAQPRPGPLRSEWLQAASVLGVLAGVLVGFVYRLNSVIVPDMDEGTYLYAGKLLAAGLVPYRDYLLAHPPLVAVLGAAWVQLVGPDVMAARLAYSVFVLLLTI